MSNNRQLSNEHRWSWGTRRFDELEITVYSDGRIGITLDDIENDWYYDVTFSHSESDELRKFLGEPTL